MRALTEPTDRTGEPPVQFFEVPAHHVVHVYASAVFPTAFRLPVRIRAITQQSLQADFVAHTSQELINLCSSGSWRATPDYQQLLARGPQQVSQKRSTIHPAGHLPRYLSVHLAPRSHSAHRQEATAPFLVTDKRGLPFKGVGSDQGYLKVALRSVFSNQRLALAPCAPSPFEPSPSVRIASHWHSALLEVNDHGDVTTVRFLPREAVGPRTMPG
jgi:hypothetical protein